MTDVQESFRDYILRSVEPSKHLLELLERPCPEAKIAPLARFAAKFREPGATFGRWIEDSGDGTPENPHKEGYWSSSPLLIRFANMVETEGWFWPVVGVSRLMDVPDYERLIANPSEISSAGVNEMRLFLTITFQLERWVGGEVGRRFNDGTLLAIVERAEQLLGTRPIAPKPCVA